MANNVNFLDLEKIKNKSRAFLKERAWNKFNNPKNVSMALSVEVSELLEIFQWLTEKESIAIQNNPKKMQDIKDELGDILHYIIRFTDLLNIDLNKAFWDKFTKNEQKYPPSLVKGKRLKYDEL